MTMQVRQAAPGDGPAVADLIQQLAATAGDASPLRVAYAEQYLRTPGSYVLLAEEEGRPVGLLSYSVGPNLYHAGPAATIQELVVEAGHRDRGVGSALVEDLLQRLAELGCVEASVTAMPDNEGAQRFYRAHGFGDEAVYLERHF
jgi:ribosomal protein S18 acetylase RimI-like enzyme